MKLRSILLSSVITASLIFSGCSSSEPTGSQPNPTQASQPATPTTQAPVPETPTTEQQPQPGAEQSKEVSGEYVGQIDSNSVEIIVEGSPKAFVLNEETQQMISSLKTKSKVSIVYTENENGQLILNKIELTK